MNSEEDNDTQPESLSFTNRLQLFEKKSSSSVDLSRRYSLAPQNVTPSFINKFNLFEKIPSSNVDLTRRYSLAPQNVTSMQQRKRHSVVSQDSETAFSISDIENRPRTPNACSRGTLSEKDFKPIRNFRVSSNSFMGSSVPLKRNLFSSMNDRDFQDSPSRIVPQRKTSNHVHCPSQCRSLFNINMEKTMFISSLTKDMTYPRKFSAENTGSNVSLFDEDPSNAPIVDYTIDWKAIYKKISVITNDDIEIELINYFHNSNIDLSIFPMNSLYRFITFNDVFEIVFSDIICVAAQVDFHEELMKNPTPIFDSDYDMNSYDLAKVIKCNVYKLCQLVDAYKDRKTEFVERLKQLKEKLDQYLKSPSTAKKMHDQIDTICRKFKLLSDVLISMVKSMSMWKLFKDLPHLLQYEKYKMTVLGTSEAILCEFRESQKKLEKQIITLFKQFRDDSSSEVLVLFDQIFSENLELSICLPIFEDKLHNDNQMLKVLECEETVRREHFV